MAAMALAASSLVSTKASLQNSMPVQAMVERRNGLGRALRLCSLNSAMSDSVDSGFTSSTTSFWCGVSRILPEPARSAASASAERMPPLTRPTMGAKPT